MQMARSRAQPMQPMQLILALSQSGVSNFALVRKKTKKTCRLSVGVLKRRTDFELFNTGIASKFDFKLRWLVKMAWKSGVCLKRNCKR